MFDKMKVEYFAVSLPDFLIFEDDLDKRNKAHCYYLIGLAKMGLGENAAAARAFTNAIELEPTPFGIENRFAKINRTGTILPSHDIP